MEYNGWTIHFDKETALEITLLISFFCYCIFIFRAQKNNPLIRITDLITGDNGRLSSTKFSQFGAFLVTTWVMVYIVITHQFTEWFFGLYMAVWSGSSLANKWIMKELDGPQQPPNQLNIGQPQAQAQPTTPPFSDK